MTETLLQLAGIAFLIVAAAMIATPLGVAVAGVSCLVIGVLRDR
jgi:hypothetical protein